MTESQNVIRSAGSSKVRTFSDGTVMMTLRLATWLEAHPKVAGWAKNDHLGFSVLYLWNGSKRKYIPDFLIRYHSGKTLVLEVKGVDSPQDQAKRAALAQWVAAVNAHCGFGTWASDVVVGEAAGLRDMVDKYAN